MTDLGSLPDWITSFGGLLALLFAAKAARTAGRLLQVEQERDTLQMEEREQQQASKVTAWWGRAGGEQGVFLRNSSDSAVYNATISLTDDTHDLLRTAVVGTIPPAIDPLFKSCNELAWQGIPEISDTRLELGFTDAQSKHWLRSGEGRLSRIAEQVVIWADENRRRALEDFATQYLSNHGVKVEVRTGRLESLSDELQGDTFAAPDIFITSHDRIGALAEKGRIIDLQLSQEQVDRFDLSCIRAAEVGSKIFGVPYAMDTVALYTNLDLLGANPVPNSLESLLEIGLRLVQQGSARLPLALPIAPYGEAFIAYPILSSALKTRDLFSLLRPGDGFTPDLTDPKSVEALQYVQDSISRVGLDVSLTRQTARAEFLAGRTPFLISTGTTLRDIPSVSFRVDLSPVPPLTNGGPAVNVTLVQLFVLGSAGRNPSLSKGLLRNHMTSVETVSQLTADRPQLPALSAVLEARTKSDGYLHTLREICDDGLVMKSNSRYPLAWQALNDLEISIVRGRSIKAAARRAQSLMERSR